MMGDWTWNAVFLVFVKFYFLCDKFIQIALVTPNITLGDSKYYSWWLQILLLVTPNITPGDSKYYSWWLQILLLVTPNITPGDSKYYSWWLQILLLVTPNITLGDSKYYSWWLQILLLVTPNITPGDSKYYSWWLQILLLVTPNITPGDSKYYSWWLQILLLVTPNITPGDSKYYSCWYLKLPENIINIGPLFWIFRWFSHNAMSQEQVSRKVVEKHLIIVQIPCCKNKKNYRYSVGTKADLFYCSEMAVLAHRSTHNYIQYIQPSRTIWLLWHIDLPTIIYSTYSLQGQYGCYGT